MSKKVIIKKTVRQVKWGGGDREAGALENRGREGYGRQERKGQEVGDLRGREVGEKCETVFF